MLIKYLAWPSLRAILVSLQCPVLHFSYNMCGNALTLHYLELQPECLCLSLLKSTNTIILRLITIKVLLTQQKIQLVKMPIKAMITITVYKLTFRGSKHIYQPSN